MVVYKLITVHLENNPENCRKKNYFYILITRIKCVRHEETCLSSAVFLDATLDRRESGSGMKIATAAVWIRRILIYELKMEIMQRF